MPALPFPLPHDPVTPIIGHPTHATLLLLQCELYSNPRSVPSPRGGGNHGHLAVMLTDEAYAARSGGQLFLIPVHPGDAPVQPPHATAAQINETVRLYTHALAEHSLYHSVSTTLQNQILASVDHIYLRALKDPRYGYGDISPSTMFTHLLATYGVLTPEDLEANRVCLSDPWNPDVPIEVLWSKIDDIKQLALDGNDAISDIAIITLTLAMFEKSGLLPTATQQWRFKPIIEWTLPAFLADFTRANAERVRQTTAAAAGYHGAHVSIRHSSASSGGLHSPVTATSSLTPASALVARTTPTNNSPSTPGKMMYYCWTHGLSINPEHTSHTCQHKRDGHQDTATFDNMQGGNSKFSGGRLRRSPSTHS